MKPHIIIEDVPTWKDTALQLLGLWFFFSSLLIGSAFDNHMEAKEAIIAQQRAIEKQERELSEPGIRLVSDLDGYRCLSPSGIRKEWELVVGQKCEELAKAMWAGREK